MSNPIIHKEVNHESVQSRQNLDRLPRHTFEKDTVDEIIFRTIKIRNRLMLELIARGGMRIEEVLKLTLNDIQDRKLIIREPKSSKEHEIVFIPP